MMSSPNSRIFLTSLRIDLIKETVIQREEAQEVILRTEQETTVCADIKRCVEVSIHTCSFVACLQGRIFKT